MTTRAQHSPLQLGSTFANTLLLAIGALGLLLSLSSGFGLSGLTFVAIVLAMVGSTTARAQERERLEAEFDRQAALA